MTSHTVRNPFGPSARLLFLALVLSLVGLTGVASFIATSRIETTSLALPIALGLLTRKEFWRKAALAYVVVQAVVALIFVSFMLSAPASHTVATAYAPYATTRASALPLLAATVLVIFGFAILRQPDVKRLVQPSRTSPGA